MFKTGLGRDATRPLRRRAGKPFTPRMYALLCLTVAALGRGKSQLLVDELVAQVRSAAADAGLDIDLDSITDRRALHAALSALVDLGVLHERDGDLEHWADQRTASLLDVRRDRLGLLVSAVLAGADGPDDLIDRAALPSAAGGARVAVCTSGQPALVVLDVIAALRGADLRYHGDFDWAGVAIAHRLIAAAGETPWRMGVADYERGLAGAGLPLVGAPVVPAWDPELGAAMRHHGRAVHEEAVLPTCSTGSREPNRPSVTSRPPRSCGTASRPQPDAVETLASNFSRVRARRCEHGFGRRPGRSTRVNAIVATAGQLQIASRPCISSRQRYSPA